MPTNARHRPRPRAFSGARLNPGKGKCAPWEIMDHPPFLAILEQAQHMPATTTREVYDAIGWGAAIHLECYRLDTASGRRMLAWSEFVALPVRNKPEAHLQERAVAAFRYLRVLGIVRGKPGGEWATCRSAESIIETARSVAWTRRSIRLPDEAHARILSILVDEVRLPEHVAAEILKGTFYA